MADKIVIPKNDPWTGGRWQGIVRNYTMQDVERLRGSLRIVNTLSQLGSAELWRRLRSPIGEPTRALGVHSGQQVVQVVKGGKGKIVGYVSGWQAAADANLDLETYSDQSIYSVASVPALVRRLNNALRKADHIQHSEGKSDLNFWIPLMADAEAGFGGTASIFELTRHMIEAGVAGIHLEDQLGSEKKCGHMGGKVLVPTSQFIRTLLTARLASDIMGSPIVIVGRTDAEAATLLTYEIDPRDKPFIVGTHDDGREMTYGEAKAAGEVFEWNGKGVRGFWTPSRTVEGYYQIKPSIQSAIARAVAYAPYCDMLWMETKTADLDDAREFAEGVHAKFPDKLLMYNCSPSFNWTQNFCKKHGIDLKHPNKTVRKANKEKLVRLFEEFQPALGKMGYKFVFITLSGFHALNASMFKLAFGFKDRGMAAFVELQEEEFAMQKDGFEAVKHQREVGTEYYDDVAKVVSGGESATLAMAGSTEAAQF